jgi:hypothetical protein
MVGFLTRIFGAKARAPVLRSPIRQDEQKSIATAFVAAPADTLSAGVAPTDLVARQDPDGAPEVQWHREPTSDASGAVDEGMCQDPPVRNTQIEFDDHAEGMREEPLNTFVPGEAAQEVFVPNDLEHELDEEWYLRRYPDVADAVREGRFASARSHYEVHGRREGRFPLPPPKPLSKLSDEVPG